MPSPSPSDLRHAIAETLRREVKDYELDGVCDRLGLPAGDGSPPNWNSKAVHVRWRLAAVDLAGLREIALRVADEFGAEDLALVVAAAGGVRGVDGRPQNLIFAATGRSHGSCCATQSTTSSRSSRAPTACSSSRSRRPRA